MLNNAQKWEKIDRCALTSATTFIYSTIHKNIKKVDEISKIALK
jgi:hypothetical protein